MVHCIYLGVPGNNFFKYLFFFQIFFFTLNSVDPDEMQHYAAFNLGLHCKSTCLGVCRIQRFNFGVIGMLKFMSFLWLKITKHLVPFSNKTSGSRSPFLKVMIRQSDCL